MNLPLPQPGGAVRLIPAGHQGNLRPSGRERVPVRVFERGNGLLMLVVLLDADTGLAPEPLDPVLLEYGSRHGLVRVHGEATLEDRDLIRFEAVEPAEVLQRREFVRIDAEQHVELTGDGEETPISTEAVDLSGGGMLVRGLEQLAEGTRLRFRLELGAGEPPLDGIARVARAGGDGERGLVFEGISPTERQRLIHFIFDRQRAALARSQDRGQRRRGQR